MTMRSVAVGTKRASERRDAILSLLEQYGYATITDLAGRFQVSDMTIRRDVRQLVDDGRVASVHGGVHLPFGLDFGRRDERARAAKRRLARAALDLAPREGTLLLDAGTTVLELAHALPGTFTGHVFTHSIAAVNALLEESEIDLFLLGGDVRAGTRSCAGPSTVAAMSEIRADVGFLGAAGIGPDGVYVANDIEQGTKNALLEASARSVLLVDGTKFEHGGRYRLCGLSDVDVIVTDTQPPPEVLDACTALEVNLRIADAGSSAAAL